MAFLFGKIILSISVVFGLTWIAEHTNSRLAGILSGMPIGTVFVILFVGIELGDGFALETTKAAGPAIATIIAFAFTYYAISFIRSRFSVLISSFSGVAGYFCAAFIFSKLDVSFTIGMLISLFTIVLFAVVFFSAKNQQIEDRTPMTFGTISFRAGLATVFVLIITGLAETLGSLWSGLLTGFPMTMLPFLIIIHASYPAHYVQDVIRNIPLGLGSLLTFLIVAKFTIPTTGSNIAVLLGLAGSIAYLICLGQVLKYTRQRV